MSLSKILTLSAASALSLASFAAYAGGAETVIANPVPVFTPNVYIGGAVGWVYSDWNSFIANGAGNDVDTNGFTFGGKLGYQATDHFGVELGGYDLPDSDQDLGFGFKGEVDSWIAYAAGTIRAAIVNPNLHAVGKVGGVYRDLNHSGNLYQGVGDGHYWTVLFGAGLDYDLQASNLPLSVGVEYLLVPGSNASFNGNSGISADAAPAAHIAVASLTYHFTI